MIANNSVRWAYTVVLLEIVIAAVTTEIKCNQSEHTSLRSLPVDIVMCKLRMARFLFAGFALEAELAA